MVKQQQFDDRFNFLLRQLGFLQSFVGMFGIANIMFVTVKERTPVIGLKKAVGARNATILFEFLLEASVLCFLGGAIGLVLVYILTLILSGPLEFPVFLSVPMIMTTVIICLVIGIYLCPRFLIIFYHWNFSICLLSNESIDCRFFETWIGNSKIGGKC